MALTRSFKDLVQSRVERDPAFGAALLREGVDVMLSGDVDGGKAILRDSSGMAEAILETANGLHRAGVMDDETHAKITRRLRGRPAQTAEPISGEGARSRRDARVPPTWVD